jgi:predicted  nucleic acid-binding Zn-ribbon protein
MPQDTFADQAARPEDVAGAQQEGVSQIQSLASDLTVAQANLKATMAEFVAAKTNIKNIEDEINSSVEKKRKLLRSMVAKKTNVEGYEIMVKDLAKKIQDATHTIIDSN